MRLELTKGTEYAIHACIVLAGSDRDPVPARRIGAEMGVPPGFLSQVLGPLLRAGVLKARSGKSGGYRLIGDPATVTILDLVELLEGPVAGAPLARRTPCALDETWLSARSAFGNVLATTTLAEVARRWAASGQQHGGSRDPLAGPAGPERIPA